MLHERGVSNQHICADGTRFVSQYASDDASMINMFVARARIKSRVMRVSSTFRQLVRNAIPVGS